MCLKFGQPMNVYPFPPDLPLNMVWHKRAFQRLSYPQLGLFVCLLHAQLMDGVDVLSLSSKDIVNLVTPPDRRPERGKNLLYVYRAIPPVRAALQTLLPKLLSKYEQIKARKKIRSERARIASHAALLKSRSLKLALSGQDFKSALSPSLDKDSIMRDFTPFAQRLDPKTKYHVTPHSVKLPIGFKGLTEGKAMRERISEIENAHKQ